MIYLKDLVTMCRSKNAGAFVLTIDIIFKTKHDYRTVIEKSEVLTAERIASLYKCIPDDVIVTPYPQITAIKITMPRKKGSGDISDGDVYGAQQHVPLMLIPASM